MKKFLIFITIIIFVIAVVTVKMIHAPKKGSWIDAMEQFKVLNTKQERLKTLLKAKISDKVIVTGEAISKPKR